MTAFEVFTDAVDAVAALLDARGEELSAFGWRAQIAQLERALAKARELEGEAIRREEAPA